MLSFYNHQGESQKISWMLEDHKLLQTTTFLKRSQASIANRFRESRVHVRIAMHIFNPTVVSIIGHESKFKIQTQILVEH